MRRPSAFGYGAAAAVAAVLTLGTAGASAATAGSAAGSAAAGPAISAAKHVPGVTWHRLTLRNGWVTRRTSNYPVASPRYAIYRGIVYLDGSLGQNTGTKREFAVLPKAARPAHDEFLLVLSGSAGIAPGTVQIKADGAMLAYRGSARVLISLAALSFPAAHGVRWHPLTLGTGWAGNGLNDASRAKYAVQGGIVYLSGSLHGKSGQVAAEVAAKLPYKDRPMANLYLSMYAVSGSAASVEITAGGLIEPFDGSYVTLSELDGISFPAATNKLSWHAIPLTGGWVSSAADWGSGKPQYAVSGPIMYLAGSMKASASTINGLFWILPKAVQPANVVTKLVYTFQGSFGALSIAQNLGLAASPAFVNAKDYTSLAAYSYPRNS